MAATSSRTLQLLSLLQTHRYWPGDQLAQRLGISIRTLRRDIERLRELGYPVSAHPGVSGGYQLEAGATMPPLLLDDEEAVSLVVALQAAAQESVAGVAEASLRALAKLTQMMPARLRHRVDALRTTTDAPAWSSSTPQTLADPTVLVTLAVGCRDNERLRFDYVSADGGWKLRRVEPARLVSLHRRWYLVAYDLDRLAWRSFRLDRITGAHRTGERFRPRTPPAPDAVSFVREGIGRVRQSFDVEVLVSVPAHVVTETVGRYGTVDELGPDNCRLSMRPESLDWPAMMLGSIGADFAVVRPPELLDLLHEWARRFAAASHPTEEWPATSVR